MSKKEERQVSLKSELVEDLMKKELPAAWGRSDKQKEAIRLATSMGAVKHGLYASIPIVCKGAQCPYANTCPLLAMDMAPEKERCPIEISQILKRFEAYTEQLQIDEEDIVDMTLVKDLIDIDIQINRADNKLADDADFLQDIVVTVTEHGDEVTNPAVHKAVDFKNALLKKRHDILQLLHSTRKDKAGDKLTVTMDPSSYAAQLMAQVQEKTKDANGRKIIDADFEEGDE